MKRAQRNGRPAIYRCRTCNAPPCYTYTPEIFASRARRGAARRPINVTHIAGAGKYRNWIGVFRKQLPVRPDNLFALTDRYCSPFTWTSGEMYADPADPSCPFRLHYGCTLYGGSGVPRWICIFSERAWHAKALKFIKTRGKYPTDIFPNYIFHASRS